MKRSQVLSLLAGASCATAFRAVPARAADTIRLGNVPIDSSSEVFSAVSQGFFAKHGLDVQIQEFTNGNAIAAAVIGGSLDVGSMNVLSVAVAYQKGVPIHLIATGAMYTSADPTTVMLVAKDSPLGSARDLAGRTVAVNVLQGIAHVSAEAWIDKNGGDAKAVKFVEFGFSAMPAALAGGRVDAAVVAEPYLTEARPETRVLGKSYDGIADRWMIDGYGANDTWIAKNGDVIRRFATAMHEASIWANHNRDKTAVTVANLTKIDLAVVQQMARSTFLEKPDLGLVQPIIDTGAKYGVLDKAFPAAHLFTPESLRA